MAESRVHACKQNKRRGSSHDSKPAELHQYDYDPVASTCKCRRDIDDGKPCNADCGHGCEESFDEAYWSGGCLWQTEECGANCNEQKVAEHHQHDGVGLCPRLENVLG